MPPRLLFLAERFPPDLGGVAVSASRVGRALAALGVEVDVLAWTRTLPPGQLETTPAGPGNPSGLRVHRIGLYGNLDVSLQHTVNALEWLHDRRRFDAVWGHYLFPAGFVAVLFGATVGVPVTVSARGNDIDRLMFPPGDFARLAWTLERAQVVSSVSADLARKIDVLVGHPRGVEVIGNAVDPDVFAPGPADEALRARLGIAPEEAVLVFAGELREKKGFPFLLDALVRVREERPACLLLVGAVRPREEAKLASFRAEVPDAGGRIVETGHLDDPADVAAHLRLSDVFLHPSVWDGLPNALLEAMACERVVLASDAGAMPEAVIHGETGFLVPRAQLHRLGDGALDLLGLPADRRCEIGGAARRTVLSRFDQRTEAAALRRVLGRLGLRVD